MLYFFNVIILSLSIMSIKITNSAQCSGCTACENICGHQAINMEEDSKGFVYPHVDADKCTECGLCERVCPYNRDRDFFNMHFIPQYYAVRCLNSTELSKSQSGGAFYMLSQMVLDKDGVVYGCSFGDYFRVEHHRAQTVKTRDRMRGSKYVQSDLGDIFSQIKFDINKGRLVLFSGTPCQVAGLRSYFGKKHPDNLITIDLLCHGVASPRFWHLYLVMLEDIKGDVIVDVKMRDKKYGWLSSDETYTFSKSEMHRNTFYSLYYSGYISRESCFECPYANKERVGDITIGDYHGWNKSHTLYADDKGMSLVIVNSLRGKNLLNSLLGNKDVYCEPTEISDSDHVALTSPAKRAEKYEAFWSDFNQHGVKYVCKKYGDMSWRTQLHIKLHNLLAHK